MNTAEELTNRERARWESCQHADRQVLECYEKLAEARNMLAKGGEGVSAVLIKQAIERLNGALAYLPDL